MNSRGLSDRSNAVLLLPDLLSFDVNVAAVQVTHFFCDVGARVLSRNFIVYSAYGDSLVQEEAGAIATRVRGIG